MKKNATKILACLLAVLMLLSCNPFFGTSFDFAAVNARAAHSDGEGGRADYSEFIGSSEVRSATPDQLLTMLLDYCDDALTYQGEEISDEFFEMTGDRYDFSSVDGVIRTGVKWIEDRRFGGDFDSLDISSVKGITRKDGDMKLLFSVFGFLVDNSKYISKLFNGEFDFGSLFTYFGVSESVSAEVIDSIQSFDLLKLLISMFGSSSEGDTDAEGEATAASLDTLLADMVNGILNGFLDEIYVKSYSAGNAISVDNIKKGFEGNGGGSSTGEDGTSDGSGDTSESGETEPEFIHSSLDISQDSLYTLIDKVIIGLFENFAFGFSGKKLDEFSIRESFAELCNYLINTGIGVITFDSDKSASSIDISSDTLYGCIYSAIEALISNNQQLLSYYLDGFVQRILWKVYIQHDVTEDANVKRILESVTIDEALWKTDSDNCFDWQVIGYNGKYFLLIRVTDSHTEIPDKGTRVYLLEQKTGERLYYESQNKYIDEANSVILLSDIEAKYDFSAFVVPADSAEREAIADKLADVTDGRVFVHTEKTENGANIVKNYIYDSADDVLYRCVGLCDDILEITVPTTGKSVAEVEESCVRLADSVRIFDGTAGDLEANGTRKLVSFSDETEKHYSVEAVYADESGKQIYLVCSDGRNKYVAKVTTERELFFFNETAKILSLLDPTVDLDVNDFGLDENYFTLGGLISQLNHILCKLAEKLLLPDVYSAIGYVDGGNENLMDNLNSVIRFALTSDKTKVLANMLLPFVTDDFAEMSEEEKAEITVSKIGVMALNKYMPSVFPADGSEFGWHKIESLPEGIAFFLSYLRAAVFGAETEKDDAYYDGCLADYRELLFAKGKDAEYWKNVNFTLLTDILMLTFKNKVYGNSEEIMQLVKYPFVNEYFMQCKANGFTWRDYLDDIVDWLLYYAKGAFPALDNVPTQIGVTDGNGAWYKLSKILQILPVTLINGCEKTYGDEKVAFDLGVFIEDIIYGGVSDLDIGKILSFISVNDSSENYFYDTPLFDAALRILSEFVNGILPGAIGDDIIENIDIITNPATLFDLVDDIFTAVGNRNEHIQDVVLKIVCMILRIDGGSTEFSKQTSFDSFAQFAAYAVYSFVIPGSVDKDIVNPYDYTDKMFDSDGNILKKDDAYWKEQTFNMLADSLVWMLIEADIGFGLTHEDIIKYKNEGWNWVAILDEIADWAIDYVDGLIPVTDTMPHERGRLDGNGPWYKISVILNSLLPTAILNGCGKTYGDETLVFDLGVFVDKIYFAACNLQLGNITEIFGRNDNELNPFSGRSLIAAALSIVQHLVNGLFPGTIEDDMLISIDNLLGRSNLARIAVNITKSINDRKQYLFPSIIELLQKLGLFDWLVPWLACAKHDYAVTKEKTIIGTPKQCYRDVHKVVCQTCSYAIVDEDYTCFTHDFEITEYDDNGTVLTKKTCKECGLTHSDADCANGNHYWSSWTEITPATCVVAGSQERVCPFCDERETSEIPALGHDYSAEWMVDVEETCTTDGSKSHHCSRCDDKTDVTEIPAKGHAYGEFEVTKQSTCTSKGSQKKVCANCGDVVSEELPALGHDYSAEWTIDTEPTCTEKGSKSHHCLRCDDKTDVTEIPAKGHAYGEFEVIKQSTCTSKGSQEKVCANCGDVVTEELPALGHDYSAEWTVDVEETCTTDGSKSRHCSRCDDKTDVSEIPAKGHAYGEFKVVKEANCTENGTKQKVCANCGDIVTEEIPALGHDWSDEWTVDKAPTCTSDGSKSRHCSRCDGKTDILSLTAEGHTFAEKKTERAATCTETGLETRTCVTCGYVEKTVLDALGHTLVTDAAVAATCTSTGLTEGKHCSVCGTVTVKQEVTAKTAHTMSDWVVKEDSTCTKEGISERKCATCGYTETKAIAKKAHTESEWITVTAATCTDAGKRIKKCTVCETVLKSETVPATDHNFGDWTVKEDSTCTKEGVSERKCAACEYTETQAIAKKAHTESEWITVTVATCTDAGKRIKKCTVCETVLNSENVPATGHNFGGWTVKEDSTCTKEGVSERKCAACGYTETQAIAKKAHTESEWITVTVATCTDAGKRVKKCTVCETVLKSETVAAHGHVDADRNGKCDNCGEELTTEKCSHICHSSNKLAQFFWKMLRLLYKMFKTHEFCDCGIKHW